MAQGAGNTSWDLGIWSSEASGFGVVEGDLDFG